eukprot:4182439-Pleurochrysis_carterae.AAC.1
MPGAVGDALELGPQRLAVELGALRLIIGRAACASARELRVIHDCLVVSGQSVSEVEGSKLFDAAQREEGVGV